MGLSYMSRNDESKRNLPSPKVLARWWQEAERQIRLAHPHESKKVREELIGRFVQAKINKYREKTTKRRKIEFSEKKLAEWYQHELIKIRDEFPSMALKEREKMAAERVKKRLRLTQNVIPLDEFI